MSDPGTGRTGAAPAYQRSSSGLVGAMIVTVLAVLAFVGWRALFRTDDATPIKAVDYQISLRAGRDDGLLAVLAPASLPKGWTATSASYTPGEEPAWHLGILTTSQKFVGVEEQRKSLDSLVATYVDENAQPGVSVRIGGQVWRSWTDSGGDYALGRTLTTKGNPESVVVVGTAKPTQIKDFVASLRD